MAKAIERSIWRMQMEAVRLIEENGRVVGIQAKSPDGELQIHADLIVGCDGRHSTIRAESRPRK